MIKRLTKNKLCGIIGNMTTKSCSMCGETKELTQFVKDNRRPLGRGSICHDCKKQKDAEYYEKNKDSVVDRARQYYHSNKESIGQKNNEKYHTDSEYRAKKIADAKAYSEKNPEVGRKAKRKHKAKLMSTIEGRLHNQIACRLRNHLRGQKKENTGDYISFTMSELKDHLESQFIKRMTWENYGEWHIDHIIPLAIFPIDEIKKAWDLRNLRPLWSEENFSKNDTIDFSLIKKEGIEDLFPIGVLKLA